MLNWLNSENGTNAWTYYYAGRCEGLFSPPWTYVEMGSAYGGGVEAIGKLNKDWQVYGYDTFEGHPKQLAEDQTALEAVCMDEYYKDDKFGTEGLSYDYQRKILDEEKLTNVILVKGLINKDSCNNIDKIHLVMLDLDIISSMRNAYLSLGDKIVKDGYLLVHDALPEGHIPKVNEFVYNELLKSGEWELKGEYRTSFLVVLRKL